MASLSGATSDLASFYAGSDVFITGATGFLGKVLIEKLLRCCPDIGTLYLLIRPNKANPDVTERMRKEITESGVFAKLRERCPDFARKLRAVAGDVGDAHLGMSPGDRRELERNVSVVIHGAATVKFHEHMQVALNINVEGIRRIIELCRGCERLKSVVHVSTAYVNATKHGRTLVGEEVEPLDFDHKSLQRSIMSMTSEQVDECTNDVLHKHGGWPNTYTFTKRIGERVVVEEGRGLPFIIVRPTIVTCAEREPSAGWLDTLIGPGGLVLATALGMLHVMPGNPDNEVDLIPVDYVINCIISCAWYAGVKSPSNERTPLAVHIGSSHRNPTRWGDLLTVMRSYFVRNPSKKQVSAIHFRWVRSMTAYHVLHYLLHIAPAMVLDATSRFRGSPTNYVGQMARLNGIVDTLLFFTKHEWVFGSHNAALILDSMSPADRQDFCFDSKAIIWDAYYEVFGHGLKKHILREDVFRQSRL